MFYFKIFFMYYGDRMLSIIGLAAVAFHMSLHT